MHRSSAKGLSALIVSIGTVLAAISAVATAGTPAKAAKANTPSFRTSSRHGVSKPLRSYKFEGPLQIKPNRAVPNERELPKQSRRRPPSAAW